MRQFVQHSIHRCKWVHCKVFKTFSKTLIQSELFKMQDYAFSSINGFWWALPATERASQTQAQMNHMHLGYEGGLESEGTEQEGGMESYGSRAEIKRHPGETEEKLIWMKVKRLSKPKAGQHRADMGDEWLVISLARSRWLYVCWWWRVLPNPGALGLLRRWRQQMTMPCGPRLVSSHFKMLAALCSQIK